MSLPRNLDVKISVSALGAGMNHALISLRHCNDEMRSYGRETDIAFHTVGNLGLTTSVCTDTILNTRVDVSAG